nr:MAG TPA: hypothetical protein [Bacteriophage sp.]
MRKGDVMIIVDYNKTLIAQGLWQYDFGQVLRIQGGNLAKAQEIHFSLDATGGDSVTRIGITQDGVTDVVIPDTMLINDETDSGYSIYVFIYKRDAESGETEKKITLKVKSRPKPEAFDTPEDKELFEEAIKAVKESAERAESAEKQAGEYAEQTKADAQQTTADRQEVEKLVESVSGIEEQVQVVKGYAEQAQTASTNALLSEQKSEQAKEAALQAQAGAETAEGMAEQHALETAGDKAEVERLATQVRQDKTAVEQTVQGFGNTAQQAIQSVQSAGTQAVGKVNTTKSDAVKAVQTEGTKQTEAVQAKGQEVINSIPSDFTTQMQSKIDKQQGAENAGKSLVIGDDGNVVPGEPTQQIEVDKTLTQEGQAADAKATGDKILQYAIKNTASGEGILRITDSAEEKPLDFAMQGKTEQASTEGKNLFDANGIDATRHILGDLSGFSDIDVGLYNLSNLILVKEGESIVKSGTTGSSVVGFLGADKSFLKGISLTDGKPVTVPAGAFYFCCNIAVANIKNKIQIEKSNTVTEYEQYTGGKPSPSVEYPQEIVNAGDSGQVEVKVTGKNLFDISKNPYKCDEEKICIPSKRLGEINITNGITFEEKTAYSLSWESYTITKPNSDWSPIFGVKYTDGINEEFYMHFYKSGTKTNANKTIGYVYIRNPWSVGTEVNRIQIEKGAKRTEYEPFKLQTLTIPLDRLITKWDRIEKRDGVYGITYSSKHVIFNGDVEETWVKSSIDNAFYLQNFEGLKKSYEIFCDKLITFKRSVNEITQNSILGNTTSLYIRIDGITDVETLRTWLSKNNLDVYYFSKESEFVQLPEETQIALNSLHTNYPTTIITNSEDCEMEVEYVCDTKNYIDNKISANVASIISQYRTNVANLLSLMPLETQATMIANDTNNILEDMEEMKHE